MTPPYLFVYGTLRKEAARKAHQLLVKKADFIGEACYQGRLYRISYYPGVVPSANPAHQVKGELYALRDPDNTWQVLDDYEGCSSHFSPPTEYVRRQQQVVLNNGQEVTAWIYLYQHEISWLEEIISGDFLEQ